MLKDAIFSPVEKTRPRVKMLLVPLALSSVNLVSFCALVCLREIILIYLLFEDGRIFFKSHKIIHVS